jgi:hypothetical protein
MLMAFAPIRAREEARADVARRCKAADALWARGEVVVLVAARFRAGALAVARTVPAGVSGVSA